MPRNASPKTHLGLPPGLPVGVFQVPGTTDADSNTAAAAAVYLHRERRRGGGAVPPAPRGEDGEAVARVDLDGVLAAQADRTPAVVAAASATAAETQEVELLLRVLMGENSAGVRA